MTPERQKELEEVARLVGSMLKLHDAKITTNIQITPMEEEIKPVEVTEPVPPSTVTEVPVEPVVEVPVTEETPVVSE